MQQLHEKAEKGQKSETKVQQLHPDYLPNLLRTVAAQRDAATQHVAELTVHAGLLQQQIATMQQQVVDLHRQLAEQAIQFREAAFAPREQAPHEEAA